MKTRLIGLAALLLLLLVLIGLPTVLLSLGLPAAGSLPSPAELLAILTRPDDGTLLVGLIAAAGWVAWLVLAFCVLLEVAAALRGIQAPTLPGLTVPQVCGAAARGRRRSSLRRLTHRGSGRYRVRVRREGLAGQ